ncbi:hypothetical protein DSO57_1019533 [Entomophthora muscae]|uniref:Uncharacterized protein n=1 Tax=Entomophthora muscae TaxID=34485 RepID=A0ACC2UQN3_9FUNG|nr:hypothetical protein DSO57_1019533 [Entomophthora muscae]
MAASSSPTIPKTTSNCGFANLRIIDSLPSIYTQFLRKEGIDNLKDAYKCILTQYQDCVEDDPDEAESNDKYHTCLVCIKPKVEDSMFVELMAVKKRDSTPLVRKAFKYPILVSPIIEKAKRLLSNCTPLDPKRTHISEPTPTRAPSPVQMTKQGVQREEAPSPKDNDGMRAHLQLLKMQSSNLWISFQISPIS